MRDTDPKPVSHTFPELQAWAGLVETKRRRDLGKAQEKPGEKWRGEMEGEGEKTRHFFPGTWRTRGCLRLGPPVAVGTYQVLGGGRGCQKCPLTLKNAACTLGSYQTLILGTRSLYQPCRRDENTHHPGPPLPSTAGETEAERGEGTCLSTSSCPGDLRIQDFRFRETSPAGKLPGPVGWGQHPVNPAPLSVCQDVYVLCAIWAVVHGCCACRVQDTA